MNFNLSNILRENIKKLTPYSSARSEFKGEAEIFLDANENNFSKRYNRYPDPLQFGLKEEIGRIKNLKKENIFLGNGSDEAIDLLFRIFCNPGKDNVIICPPTYGMYEVCANINDVEAIKIPLIAENFDLNVDEILRNVDENTKMIFICNPNNPTGNLIDEEKILKILNSFNKIVVIDEAYIDFAGQPSYIEKLKNYPNLVILQTFSKAYGLAGLRIGMAFASEEIIQVFNKIKPPYNINSASQEIALKVLQNKDGLDNLIKKTLSEKERLIEEVSKLDFLVKIYPSYGNFLFIKVKNADELHSHLSTKKIVVRNRNAMSLCHGCLRITVGNEEENDILLKELREF